MSERKWAIAAGVLLALLAGPAQAVGPINLPPAGPEPRVPVAKVVSAVGVVASEGVGEPFTRVRPGELAYSRDLLVALPGLKADLEPKPQSLRLTLWGNLPGLSDSPVLESAVILHDSSHYDLDLTVVRGRVVLTNKKEKGPVKVWIRARGGIEATLPEPGDSAALEIYGRWAAGVRKPGEVPTIFWEVHVLKGNLEIKAGKDSWSMSAPPGPAYFQGDTVSGPDPSGPQKRSKLPAWADPEAPKPPEAKLVAGVVAGYLEKLRSRDVREAGRELLAAADKDKDRARANEARRLLVHALAAIDAVDEVAQELDDSKHPHLRQCAVIGLRHWLGAAPGRDEKLHEVLTEQLGYKKAEADTVLQLLHSPFDPDRPEAYETLIAYLRHQRVAVRELAAWHLYRMVPAGRDIPFDAAGSKEEVNRAYQAWKKLIPSGELPPAPKEKPKKDKDAKKEKG